MNQEFVTVDGIDGPVEILLEYGGGIVIMMLGEVDLIPGCRLVAPPDDQGRWLMSVPRDLVGHRRFTINEVESMAHAGTLH